MHSLLFLATVTLQARVRSLRVLATITCYPRYPLRIMAGKLRAPFNWLWPHTARCFIQIQNYPLLRRQPAFMIGSHDAGITRIGEGEGKLHARAKSHWTCH